MKFDARSGETAAKLRQWLQNRAPKPGERLPSERALAAHLGQTHYAVNRAVARLLQAGLLKREGYRLLYAGAEPRSPLAAPFHLVVPRDFRWRKLIPRLGQSLAMPLRELRWESLENAVLILEGLRPGATSGILFDVPFSEQTARWRPAVARLLAEQVPCFCLDQPVEGIPGLVPDHRAALGLAFRHLLEMGHAELALVAPVEQAPNVTEVREHWAGECLRLGLTASAQRCFTGSSRSPRENARELAQRLQDEWSPVTALAVHERALVPHLLDELARRGRGVPADLSIIAIGDSSALQKATPPITSVSFDTDGGLYLETALRTLAWLAAKKAELGKLPHPPRLRMEPALILRASTAPRKSQGQAAPAPGAPPVFPGQRWPDAPDQRRHLAHTLAHKPYPLVAGARGTLFEPVDLRPHLNRPIASRRGWLGDLPLRNLPTGSQNLHGVVFDIAQVKNRPGPGAIVFRSSKNSTGTGRELPATLRLELHRPARAVYFLHGCGFSGFLKECATYRFLGAAGELATLPLITLGALPLGLTPEAKAQALYQANIQDWWPDFLQTDFAHSRRLPIAQDQETMQSYRYLYTLEWINPRPEETLEAIEITVHSGEPATLGLLAISTLKASPSPDANCKTD